MTETLAALAQGETLDAAATVQRLLYLVAAACFIVAIRMLRAPKSARRGNAIAALGMLTAVIATLLATAPSALAWIAPAVIIGAALGVVLAVRVQMTQMPQMVALFNGFGGAASALVAGAEWLRISGGGVEPGGATLSIMGVSVLIGLVTLTGSLVAGGKLHGVISGKPVRLPAQLALNAALLLLAVIGIGVFAGGGAWVWLALVAVAALVLGVTLTVPIGGADMPVMVSLLNAYSGLAAAAAGFLIGNWALIVAGALVGASGLILTAIMCKAMNRSLANVLFAGIGSADSTGAAVGGDDGRVAKFSSPDDMALILDGASKVMVVPGYGMAVAQAQHAVRELGDRLADRGVEVIFAVHSVAGRMPGHMNVLLAEADVDYDQLYDTDQANGEVAQCDAAIVIGANDVVNPAARTDEGSAIYGMPIIDVDKARTVFVLKRSLGAGYAGVENDLFFQDNTLMVLGDAKQTVQATIAALKGL